MRLDEPFALKHLSSWESASKYGAPGALQIMLRLNQIQDVSILRDASLNESLVGHIDLSINDIEHLPELRRFCNLRVLDISVNHLSHLTPLYDLNNLLVLNLSNNMLKKLDDMPVLQSLTELVCIILCCQRRLTWFGRAL